MLLKKIDKGLANPELGQGIPATLQFRYTFKTPIASMAEAFVKKYQWEMPTRHTVIEKVEQLDADRIIMYRRHDIYNAPFITWEQVLINRQNQSIESDIVGANPNGTPYSISKTVLRPNLATKTVETLMDQYVFDVQGRHTGSVDLFKQQVLKIQ